MGFKTVGVSPAREWAIDSSINKKAGALDREPPPPPMQWKTELRQLKNKLPANFRNGWRINLDDLYP